MKDFIKYTLATIVGFLIVNAISGFLMLMFFIGIASMSEKTPELKNSTVLYLKLNKPIVERAEENPFEYLDLKFKGLDLSGELGLDDIIESIKNAKSDGRIEGIYLNPSHIMAGYATVEEIRNALLDFKESGKFIYAYADSYSQKSYYLASVADELILNPQGMLDFRGLAGSVTFYKEMLSKIGVKMEIIRHGKFKAAVEPFITDKMSPESRLQMENYLNSIWGQILSEISVSRDISVEELNKIANETTTFLPAEDLVELGLIDELKYKDQVIGAIKKLTGTRSGHDVRSISPSAYAKVVSSTKRVSGKGNIAVVYAEGGIDVGSEGIDSEKLSRTIRKIRENPAIKAMVLRINSPGGSAYGSEVVWREVALAKSSGLPVVVSMGDVAASGGYYIACAADEIFAERTTITGSIGIFAQIPNASELLVDKMGLTQDFVSTNENAVFYPTMGFVPALSRPLSSFERNQLQAYIERGYQTFISRVAEGRGITTEEVDAVGQGRVWAAKEAKENGLVDELGTINDAIARAAELAELETYSITKFPEKIDPIQQLLTEASKQAKGYVLRNELGIDYSKYMHAKESLLSGGIMARLPYDVNIE